MDGISRPILHAESRPKSDPYPRFRCIIHVIAAEKYVHCILYAIKDHVILPDRIVINIIDYLDTANVCLSYEDLAVYSNRYDRVAIKLSPQAKW